MANVPEAVRRHLSVNCRLTVRHSGASRHTLFETMERGLSCREGEH